MESYKPTCFSKWDLGLPVSESSGVFNNTDSFAPLQIIWSRALGTRAPNSSFFSPPSLARGVYFCTLLFVNQGFRWWRAFEGFWAGVLHYQRGVSGKSTELCSARDSIRTRGCRWESQRARRLAQWPRVHTAKAWQSLRLGSRVRNLFSFYSCCSVKPVALCITVTSSLSGARPKPPVH